MANSTASEAKDTLYACRAHFTVDVCGNPVYLSIFSDVKCSMDDGLVAEHTATSRGTRRRGAGAGP